MGKFIHDTHTVLDGITRRKALFTAACGFGGLALCGLLWGRRPRTSIDQRDGRARNVIFLYMDGGPSHMDTFDPKPQLSRHHGKPYIPPGKTIAAGPLMGSPYRFKQYGESGHAMSEIFPHLGGQADELTIVRSMVSDYSNHATAGYFLNTGSPKQGHPSMGSWINYGLGSECADLPGFVVLESGQIPEGGLATFDSGFLPAKYRATLVRQGANPIDNVTPLAATDEIQNANFAFLKETQARQQQTHSEPEVDALLDSYELAFRMQTAVPDLMNLNDETPATLALFGINEKPTDAFGRACLLARRLVERGVRFIQLLPPKLRDIRHWDQHLALEQQLRENAEAVDKPIAGLIEDLRSRGLLDQTLIVWGGEFGRTPNAELHPPYPPGRNHNPHGFTIWLAGGGLKPGISYGATDEFGGEAVEKPVQVHDLQATILHLLGIDHTKLTFAYGGREFRLTDVYGNVVHELIA